jgi:arginase
MDVDVIVAPFDSGLRGVRMGRGPDRLLELGLADRLRASGARVEVCRVAPPADVFPSETRMAFELQRLVAERVAAARRAGRLPIVLSGNCNTAVGTVSGLHATNGASPVACWFDAHADFNTPESTIGGFLDGMSVAMLTGRCWRQLTARVPGFRPLPESHVVLIGARDLDPLERELVDSSSLRVLAPGAALGPVVSATLSAGGTREMYLHLDLDVIDPSQGRANGFAVAGGLTRSALLAAVDDIQATGIVAAAAITAYDPDCDDTGSVAEIALEVAARLASGRRA